MHSEGQSYRYLNKWWSVIACAIFYLFLGGTYFYGFTALFNPIVEEFSWSYALVSLAFTLRGFEAGILAPIVGVFVDKLGPRKLILCGVFIISIGFGILGIVRSLWSFYVASLILSLGNSLTSPVVTMTAVTKMFKSHTNLAIGLLTAGIAAGGLLVPVSVWAIDQFGWRESVTSFAVLTLILGLPLLAIIRDLPKDTNIYPANEKVSPESHTRQIGMTAGEAIQTRNFWLLSLAIFFSGIASMAMVVHLIPFLVSTGISRQTGGYLSIIFAATNIAGRLLFGWMSDAWDKKWCFIVAILFNALGLLTCAFSRDFWHFVLSLTALGFGFGGFIPLRAALQIEYFGIKSFSTLQGLLMTAITLGAVISPLFAGWMFDTTASYRLAFIILGIVTLVALPLVFNLSKARFNNYSGSPNTR